MSDDNKDKSEVDIKEQNDEEDKNLVNEKNEIEKEELLKKIQQRQLKFGMTEKSQLNEKLIKRQERFGKELENRQIKVESNKKNAQQQWNKNIPKKEVELTEEQKEKLNQRAEKFKKVKL